MSTEVTQVLNLEKHLKTCVLPIVCSPKATNTISKVSMPFFLFEANCDLDMLFFQFCHFIGIPNLKMEQHIHSFIPLARAECDDSVLFSGASSIPLCCILFPVTLLHQLFFHPLSLMEQHILVFNEASLTSNICYNLIPS
jgi:hypothetical protein